ncbi:MAG TPA: response regulator transcription factor [Solirubrobacterales bacterium]|nr:response regulator transcription factor [Solirubrobacterales bacterium]
MIRVVLADDEALIRSGLRMILEAEPDIRVIGEAEDGGEALDLAVETDPDLVVMDLRMPEMDGIEATKLIRRRMPSVRVLVVTTFDLDEYVLAALRGGADGFLLKDAAPEALVDAVRTVAAGDALLAPTVTRRLIGHYVGQAEPDERLTARLGGLTERELDVTKLVARGMTNSEIADELFLGNGTVKTHVTAILSKLGLANRAQIVVAAYESGLIVVGETGTSA